MTMQRRWEWEARIWTADLHAGVKVTALALASHLNDEGEAWPSLNRLAKMTSQTVRTVRRQLADLDRKGLLKRSQNAGKVTVYRVLTPDISAGGTPDIDDTTSADPGHMSRGYPGHMSRGYPGHMRHVPRTSQPGVPRTLTTLTPDIDDTDPGHMRHVPRTYEPGELYQEPNQEPSTNQPRAKQGGGEDLHKPSLESQQWEAEIMKTLPPRDDSKARFPGWPDREALPIGHALRADFGPDGQDTVQRWWQIMAGHPQRNMQLKLYWLRAFTAVEWAYLVAQSATARNPLAYASKVATRMVATGGVNATSAPDPSRAPRRRPNRPECKIFVPPPPFTAEDRAAMLQALRDAGEVVR